MHDILIMEELYLFVIMTLYDILLILQQKNHNKYYKVKRIPPGLRTKERFLQYFYVMY